MNNLLAWLLFGVALAWSILVGLLAGVDAVVVARQSTDALNILVAVLFMFGGGILLALALQSGARLPLFRDEPKEAVEVSSEDMSNDSR